MSTQEKIFSAAGEIEIRQAYIAGKDRAKNGANQTNCNLRHFATPEQTKAWEQGAAGEELHIEIITIQ